MYKNFNLTDQEKREILEMHQSHGYKKPEEKLISESQATSMAQKALEAAKSGQTDKSMMDAIVNCIKSNSYSHLMVLTTGVGSSALGALAALFVSGVGAPVGMVLLAAGAIITTIEGMMTTTGSGGGSVTSELESLYNCLKTKKVI